MLHLVSSDFALAVCYVGKLSNSKQHLRQQTFGDAFALTAPPIKEVRKPDVTHEARGTLLDC